MTSLIPKDAEEIAVSQFIRTRRSPSRLVKGLEQVETLLACPRCDHARAYTVNKFNCAGCGLAIQAGISTMRIWTEETAKEPA
jgi:ribosomal protein L37E